MKAVKRFWRSLRCLFGSHPEWEAVYGALVIRCPHCGHVEIQR